jgi:hypothetical protein
MNGGGILGGSALGAQTVTETVTLLPINLSFGPTNFDWVGFVTDIDDPPNADSNDGDGTHIRQQVSGPQPTQWGYVYCGFDLTDIPTIGPFTFILKVAHRRETEVGVELIPELLVNSVVVYTGSAIPSTSYAVFNSGTQPMPTITSIEDMQVRLSMFTNTGNFDPRVLRISAVSLDVAGYQQI